MFTCIVTDYVEPDLEWEAAQYRAAGIAFEALQLRGAAPADLAQRVATADVLIVDQATITAEVIDAMTRCRLIIRHGDGYDNLDLAAATAQGIVCANKPGFWSREVAELALGLSLALCLRLPEQQRVAAAPLPEGGWDLARAMPQRSIAGMTVGVLGYGKIGRHAVRLFRAVCERVLVHDPAVPHADILSAGAVPATLDHLLSQSDIVTMHVPATSETIRLFDHDRISRMKPGALLVNTSRGPIVDTDALVAALERGHLAGAGLDVTSPEPLPPTHPLFSFSNVIVTPHLGWYSEDAMGNMRRSIVADVISAAGGTPPATIVNPDVLDTPGLRFGKASS